MLAHRGRHWTLLQNICKDFWNCLQMVLTAAKTPDKNGNDLLDDDSVCKIAWKPLYFAADCLLDMIVQTQEQLMKVIQVVNAIVCICLLIYIVLLRLLL